jgi:hypothetical protein
MSQALKTSLFQESLTAIDALSLDDRFSKHLRSHLWTIRQINILIIYFL